MSTDPEPAPDPRVSWRWLLNATALKLAAAKARQADAADTWTRTVEAARTAGVPERLITSAAQGADVPVPGEG